MNKDVKHVLIIPENPDAMQKLANMSILRDIAYNLKKRYPKLTNNEILNEGVYLLPLEHGLQVVFDLHEEISIHGLSCRTLFFDSEPTWIITPSKIIDISNNTSEADG